MKSTGARPKITVSADGRGVVGHAGARLLVDLAEATGLTDTFGQALAGLRRRHGHDPGRIAVDLAAMIADGGQAIADLAVLRDQAELFGAVASDPTAWRLLSSVDDAGLARLRQARATARELVWAQVAETRTGLPASRAAGRVVPGLVMDLDAVPAEYCIHAGRRRFKPSLDLGPLARASSLLIAVGHCAMMPPHAAATGLPRHHQRAGLRGVTEKADRCGYGPAQVK